MMASPNRRTQWSDDLRKRVDGAISVGEVVMTLSNSRPNRIDKIDQDGVHVETTKSAREGTTQLVPGWMFQAAWDELAAAGELTNRRLLDDLNVKRSSAVCAILSRLPGVSVASTRPIRLVLRK